MRTRLILYHALIALAALIIYHVQDILCAS